MCGSATSPATATSSSTVRPPIARATRRHRCRLEPRHRLLHRWRRGPRRLRRRVLARARHRRRRAGDRRTAPSSDDRPPATPTSSRSTRSRPICCRSARTTRRPRTCRTCCASARSIHRNTPTCTAYARTGGVAGTHARSHHAAGRSGDDHPRQPAATRRHVRCRRRPAT